MLLQHRLASIVRDPLVAVVIASIVFGLMHLPVNAQSLDSVAWSLVWCIGGNAFGGALLGYIYLRTRSLLVVAIVHWWSAVATGAAT